MNASLRSPQRPPCLGWSVENNASIPPSPTITNTNYSRIRPWIRFIFHRHRSIRRRPVPLDLIINSISPWTTSISTWNGSRRSTIIRQKTLFVIQLDLLCKCLVCLFNNKLRQWTRPYGIEKCLCFMDDRWFDQIVFCRRPVLHTVTSSECCKYATSRTYR